MPEQASDSYKLRLVGGYYVIYPFVISLVNEQVITCTS